MWSLQNNQAELTDARLRARVNLAQPQQGLGQLEADGTSLPHARILQLVLPGLAEASSLAPEEPYIRQEDLIASYPLPQHALRAQVYWRLLPLQACNYPAVQLILSMQTQLLDSEPSLLVRSQLPAVQCHRLQDVKAGRWDAIDPQTSDQVDLMPDVDAPVIVVRLPAVEISYIEIVHPTDLVSAHLEWQGDQLHTRHQLFAERLEKGVIRRGRVTGLFVARENDLECAIACYRELLTQSPPLTT